MKMNLEKEKKIVQQSINYKRQQFKAVGDNSSLMGEIKNLEEATANIENTLICAENRKLKNLLAEGLELMERLENENKGVAK